MPALPIKLYYLPPSPSCRIVMMTAAVMGLELELNLTNIMEDAHKTPEFTKMNPQQTVPTMDDNGFILWESRAIIAYFVNAYGKDDSLYPKNPRHRALVDSMLNFDISTLYPKYIDLYQPIFAGEAFNKEKSKKLNEALGILNTLLGSRAFAAGDNMTIADISILITITNLNAFNYDMTAQENVLKWFEKIKTLLKPYGYMEIDYAGAQVLADFIKQG